MFLIIFCWKTQKRRLKKQLQLIFTGFSWKFPLVLQICSVRNVKLLKTLEDCPNFRKNLVPFYLHLIGFVFSHQASRRHLSLRLLWRRSVPGSRPSHLQVRLRRLVRLQLQHRPGGSVRPSVRIPSVALTGTSSPPFSSPLETFMRVLLNVSHFSQTMTVWSGF